MGVASFSFMDAGLKLLTAHYPSAQVAALRGLAALPVVFVWVLYAGGARQLVRVRWPLHLIRGVLSVFMMITFAFALKELSLAKTYALFFVAPLLIAIFSIFMLGERIQRAQWLAIVIGFAGVLIVLRPDTGAASAGPGTLAVLGTAVCYALSSVLVKIIGRTDSTQSMVFWMTCMLAIGATTLALPDWQPIAARALPADRVGIAITGAIGQWGITEAFKRAPAASVAPLEYSGLAWVIMIDFVGLVGDAGVAHAGGRRGDHRQRPVPAAVRVAARKLARRHNSAGSALHAAQRFGNTSPHGDRDRASDTAADHGSGAFRALQFLAAGRRVAADDHDDRAAAVHHPFPQAALASRHAAMRHARRCSRRVARWRWPKWSIRRRCSTTSRARMCRREQTRALHHYRIYLGAGGCHEAFAQSVYASGAGKVSRAFASLANGVRQRLRSRG